MKHIYLPLSAGSKIPREKGWAAPDYEGVPKDGLVARRLDNLVVVDADTMDAAEAWLAEGPPTPVRVMTKRGMHFYYRRPDGTEIKSSPMIVGALDVKTGSGSYVLPEGVTHPSGARYESVGEIDPEAMTLDDLPDAPEELILSYQGRRDTGDGEGWEIIPEGRRNGDLAGIGGYLRKQGYGEEMIRKTLLGLNLAFADPPLPDEEIATIAASVSRYEPDPDVEIEFLDDLDEAYGLGKRLLMSGMVEPPPAQWLWKPYLPKGRLVLLDGAEGIGKGLLCARMAVQMTSGGMTGTPQPVLWLAAEDDPEEDVWRRLMAAGYQPGVNADVHFVTSWPKFPEYTDALKAEVEQTNFGLVILDPGRSYLGPPDDYGKQERSYNDEAFVRPGMEALNRAAKSTEATIIFVHHWNKNAQVAVDGRTAGSKAFRQVVRHALTLAFNGNSETGEGALAVVKSNIAPTGQLRSYYVKANERYDTALFDLGDELADYTLDDWLDRMKKEGNVANNPEELIYNNDYLVEILEENYPPPMALPKPRDFSAAHAGWSKRRAERAYEDLMVEGVIVRSGDQRYRWGVDDAARAIAGPVAELGAGDPQPE